jgi:hypothetical protein
MIAAEHRCDLQARMIQQIAELLAAAFSPRINRVVILQAPMGGRTSCGEE